MVDARWHETANTETLSRSEFGILKMMQGIQFVFNIASLKKLMFANARWHTT